MLSIRADSLALGKVSPHELVLIHNDRHLAINSQQHQQVCCGNKIDKVNLHGSSLQKWCAKKGGLLKRLHSKEIGSAGVKLLTHSVKIRNVHQGASQKYRLLFKLLFSRPSEFFDRVKTRAEGIVSATQSPAAAEGLDLAAMV